LASIATRATSILTLVFLVPAAHEALGPERFGLWMLLSSLTMVLSFADLGLGNGIMNEVAAANGHDDIPRLARAASCGFFMLAAIAAAAGIIFAAAYPFAPWATAFNVRSPEAQTEAALSVAVFAVCFLVSLPLSIANKIQLGMQDGFLANSVLAVANVVAFCGVYAGLRLHAGVPLLVALLFGMPPAVQALTSAWYFHRRHPELRPRLGAIDGDTVRKLARAGLAFFFMQLCLVVTSRFDAFFIAREGSVEQAGLFLSCERLFAFASVLPLSFVYPLWPAYREALHRADVAWVRRAFLRSIALAFGLTAAICLPMMIFGDRIFNLWFHTRMSVPMVLLAGFAFWKVIEGLSVAGAMLMNGAGRLRAAMIMHGSMAAISLIAKLSLVDRFGVYSIIWITALSWALCCVAPIAYFAPAILRDAGLSARQDRRLRPT
jgi:O-antigen/teichoic acid export membrane protein